jgi:hypothetical protein
VKLRRPVSGAARTTPGKNTAIISAATAIRRRDGNGGEETGLFMAGSVLAGLTPVCRRPAPS